jgi:hypothetical protein
MNKKYNSSYELCQEIYYEILDAFGERFVGEENKTLDGVIYGKIDSREFLCRPFLTVEGSIAGLAVSAMSKHGGSVLSDLNPVLTKVMNGAKPICSFDLEVQFNITNSVITSLTKTLPTIEWNIYDPEKRIADIKAGKTLGPNERINNLCVFGEKDSSKDSKSPQLSEEEQERVKKLLSMRQEKFEKYIDLKREIIRLGRIQNILFSEIDGINIEICQRQGHRLLNKYETNYNSYIDEGSKPVYYRVCEICGEKVRIEDTKDNDVVVKRRTFPKLK